MTLNRHIICASFLGLAACSMLHAQEAALPASDCLYGLRPEALQLSSRGLPGRVHMIEPTGPETLVYADVAGTPLVAALRDGEAVTPGQVLWLQADVSHLHRFHAATGVRV